MRPLLFSAFVLATATLTSEEVRAERAPREAKTSPKTSPKVEQPAEDPLATKSGYLQIFATVMAGTGLRFNNPYRLATPLGDDAESVSRTAAYVDLGLAMTFFGNPRGFQHGAALRTSIAAEGVGQVVLTPSYFIWRRARRLAAFGRAGVPMVLTPDVTWGLEAGIGGAFFLFSGIGLVAEIVGDLFYGAGTRESRVVTYPVLSGQIGIIASLEFLP